MDTPEITDCNRLAWDATAIEHRENQNWERLKTGFSRPEFSTFDETMTKVLNELPVKKQSIVQVGCNNGRELLSAMSLGAKAGFGIDQSSNFIDQAQELTVIAGRDCKYVRANVYELPAAVPRDFDIALITIGVLNWMPDLTTFFNVVSGLLNATGRLVIYETHPFLEMFKPGDANPYTVKYSYFADEPHVSEETFVYDNGEPSKAPVSYWFTHRFGEIINACIQAGLDIDSIDEYPHSNRETEYDLYTHQNAQLPMCFTLTAHKR